MHALKYTGAILPLSAIPSLVSYNFNQTYLVIGSDYYNVVLGNLTTSMTENSTTTVVCDDCFLQSCTRRLFLSMKMDRSCGLRVFSKAIHLSAHIPGIPCCQPQQPPHRKYSNIFSPHIPTRAVLKLHSSSTTPTGSASCGGTTYAVQPGDTCTSISLSQGIGTF